MSPLARLKLFTFIGALLLFGLEPLVGRLLLPSCGGSFQVWATCLTVFQGTLFLGYLYVHLLAPRLGRWHLAVLAVPLLFLPIAAAADSSTRGLLVLLLDRIGLGLAPPDPHAPVLSIVRLLAVGVCVPFAALATTGVVAQAWLARSDLPERHEPYQLYSASNLGSLVALLGYPLLVEPWLGLGAQRGLWSVAFLGYLALAFAAAPRRASPGAPTAPAAPAAPAAPVAPVEAVGGPVEPVAPATKGKGKKRKKKHAAKDEAADEEDEEEDEVPVPPGQGGITPGRILFWLGLAAAPSMFLTAVTNVIALDVGSMPLVWVAPLGIYLLSFVLAFGRRPWYPELLGRFWPEMSIVALYHFTAMESLEWWRGLIHLGALFVVCVVAHGELFRDRPEPRHLSGFYLVMSLGGWLGGAFVSLVAPHVLTSLAEYPIALALLGLTVAIGRRRDFIPWIKSEPPVVLGGSLVLVAIIGMLWLAKHMDRPAWPQQEVRRTVYGIYRVVDRPTNLREVSAMGGAEGQVRLLYHGTTLHGKQVKDRPEGRIPISYYHPKGPLGDALAILKGPRRAGLVGLGAGTTAAHFGAGESVTFYELDPQVETLARTWFTYIKDSPADVKVVVGDARLRLQDAPDRGYDCMLIDAFSSDSIPLHLITREAIELYRRKLAPKGLLLFHVSNRYYDLKPVVAATGAAAGFAASSWKSHTNTDGPDPIHAFEDASDYIVLAEDEATLEPLLARRWWRVTPAQVARGDVWTDDHANVLGALTLLNDRGLGPP